MDLPNYGAGSTIYRVDAFDVDNDDRTVLVLYGPDAEPEARMTFDRRDVDNAPLAGPNVANWLRNVTYALLNDDGHGRCADCGNPGGALLDVALDGRTHAHDCDYRDV